MRKTSNKSGIILFKKWNKGESPKDWKTSTIIPIQKNDPIEVKDFRPISLTPVIGKMFESIMLKDLAHSKS